MKPDEIVVLIGNINELYTNLVSYTIGVMLFAGALIPGVISFFLNRQIRVEHESATKRLLAELEDAKSALASSLTEKVSEEIKNAKQYINDLFAQQETELSKKIAKAEGKLFHLQGNNSLQDSPNLSIPDFIMAAQHYITGHDEINLRRVLEAIKECLSKLDKSAFKKNPELEDDVKKLLANLKIQNENGRYYDISREISLFLDSALERETIKESTN